MRREGGEGQGKEERGVKGVGGEEERRKRWEVMVVR